MSVAGNFKIDVWKGGHPVWCEVKYLGEVICKLHHSELRDLEYAVTKAMREAREELPDKYKDEV